MSAIGRVFLILNLVLAAAFLGWASTSLGKSAEYKSKYESEVAAHKATTDALGKDKADLLAQINQLKTDKAGVEDQRDQAKAEADRNKADLEEQRRGNDQLRGDYTKIAATLDGIRTDITAANTAKDRAVQAQHDAEKERDAARDDKDKADLARRDAEDKTKTLEAQKSDLEKSLVAANKKSSALDTQLSTLVQATGVSASEIIAQPAITGSVLSVDMSVKPGLIAINRGETAGVKRGFTFEIYAGNQYKGRARVETVRPDMCSALITFTAPGAKITQGDTASTQL
jgi:septal ring factor EnvC (AmiA/AmiB activator)